MKHFINLKDIPVSKILEKLLLDAKKRKNLRKNLKYPRS